MSEQRLIDAEALLEKLSKMIDYCEKDKKVNSLTALFQVGDAIMDCLTVEAKPVVHAHWLEQIIDGSQELMCSNCGEYALMNDEFYSEFSKYCPYCGAQMDEEADDG